VYSVEGLPAKASGVLTYADGMLYLVGEPGNFALMPASTEGFNIVASFNCQKMVKALSGLLPSCVVGVYTCDMRIFSIPTMS